MMYHNSIIRVVGILVAVLNSPSLLKAFPLNDYDEEYIDEIKTIGILPTANVNYWPNGVVPYEITSKYSQYAANS